MVALGVAFNILHILPDKRFRLAGLVQVFLIEVRWCGMNDLKYCHLDECTDVDHSCLDYGECKDCPCYYEDDE